ncbi:MAG: histidine--tRNA ligase [Actinomycetota bacterium]|nr:histidine--tRNA ligase [Actinomycetota bacterium]
MKLNSPRGTTDIYGEDIEYRNYIINTAREIFEVFNYKEIITPAFEHTGVFSRSIGEGTDIVQKEMYTFRDKKGRSLTLRPEGTASIARAVVENKNLFEGIPLKFFYIGNMFRYERPQKGRMREFWQIGIESIGTDSPLMDSEVIWMLNMLFEKLGFEKLVLKINSIGCDKCRKDFLEEFKKYIKPRLGKLCADCRNRFEKNSLRIFDCKKTGCKKIIEGAPSVISYLCPDCRKNFEEVLNCMKTLGINYRIDNKLVRGFDYYTGAIFEVVSEDIKSEQNALGGGGRYNNLIKQLGGPDVPATGFAIGVDRIIMLMKQLNIEIGKQKKNSRVYLISMEKSCREYSLNILKCLRDIGVTCDINFNDRSLKKEIKWADNNGYDFVIIIGEDEVRTGSITIKNIKKFKQYKISWDKEKEKIKRIIGA